MTESHADDAAALANGDHRDPFAYLGMHEAAGRLVVRAFLPGAHGVAVIDTRSGAKAGALARIHDSGLFEGTVGGAARFPYRLAIDWGGATSEIVDSYQFPPWLGDLDRHLIGEGTHAAIHDMLGAHVTTLDGHAGVAFAVWAPNARRASVVGDFNHWDGRRHAMRLHPGIGIWEIFVPGLGAGERYKFEIKTQDGTVLPLKADPLAFAAEHPPNTASIVHDLRSYRWNDAAWLAMREARNHRAAPISIYEVHLGSWRRRSEHGNRYLTYRELAAELIPYVKEMGFTHIEVLPVSEYPFDGSWGYQPIGLFAPTSRFGTPDDFRAFVDAVHAAELGLILDWVPGHFPNDPHGLANFDGTHLYEHADPRQGQHKDWGTLIYNYGRREVAAFLRASGLFWLDRYHVDALRVDAVASMLYLDYSRAAGEWVANELGGRENLDAVGFLRRFNQEAYARIPGITTIAEESTAWPMVSRPVSAGGLGFGYKWNMGWMHDTLEYIARDPLYRKHDHHQLTFGLVYAFSENFVLAISHDEVVHGKGSMLGRMPGDRWQRFANLRLYYTFMFGHPGKKLLFMGCEFGQEREWNHDVGLDWHLLGDPAHDGVRSLVRDLNRVYRDTAALHERDCEPDGFEWIDENDRDNCVISFIRRGRPEHPVAVVVCNFTPVVRHGYRIGVSAPGIYREILNSDAAAYGGSNVGNCGAVEAEAVSCHGRPYSLPLTLPPLGGLILLSPPA